MGNGIGWAIEQLDNGRLVRRSVFLPGVYLKKTTGVTIVFRGKSYTRPRHYMVSNHDLFAKDWELYNAE